MAFAKPSGLSEEIVPVAREDPVQQIKGMLRDTWWLWLLFCLMNTFLVVFLSPMFAVIYPVLAIVCVYFALGRYDENGQERQDF